MQIYCNDIVFLDIFSTLLNGKPYEFSLDLYGPVQLIDVGFFGGEVLIHLQKQEQGNWPRLLYDTKKVILAFCYD